MEKYLINDKDRLWRSQKHVGSKAANLTLLLENGYPVPPYFVVTTKVFSHFHKELNKGNKDVADYKIAQDFFSAIKFGNRKVRPGFWKQFNHYFLNLHLFEPTP